MKKKHLKFNLITALIAFVSLSAASPAIANLSFSGAKMTATSFSVDVSGSLPTEGPTLRAAKLFVVNASSTTAPRFVQPKDTFAIATSHSFSGTPKTFFANAFGTDVYGEATLEFAFTSDLAADAELSGTLSATWNDSVLVPSAVDSLEYYWGGEFEGSTPTGILLGSSTVVPEPSAAALLLGLGAMGLAAVRRRSRD